MRFGRNTRLVEMQPSLGGRLAPPGWEDYVVETEPCGITFDVCCSLLAGAASNASALVPYQFGASSMGVLV